MNLEASFQAAESSADIETVRMPLGITPPTEAPTDAWSSLFSRVWLTDAAFGGEGRTGAGRAAAWLRTDRSFGDDPLLHRCMLAHLSDDLPTDAVLRADPLGQDVDDADRGAVVSASLDQTMWFHRPLRVDEWHLHDFTCHSFVGGRGLTIGHVFAADGTHAATIAQEVLLRDSRRR